jgi:hypothetical protein
MWRQGSSVNHLEPARYRSESSGEGRRTGTKPIGTCIIYCMSVGVVEPCGIESLHPVSFFPERFDD